MRRVDELVALRDLGDIGAAQELHDLAERQVRDWMRSGGPQAQLQAVADSLTDAQRQDIARLQLAQVLFGWIP